MTALRACKELVGDGIRDSPTYSQPLLVQQGYEVNENHMYPKECPPHTAMAKCNHGRSDSFRAFSPKQADDRRFIGPCYTWAGGLIGSLLAAHTPLADATLANMYIYLSNAPARWPRQLLVDDTYREASPFDSYARCGAVSVPSCH